MSDLNPEHLAELIEIADAIRDLQEDS